MRSRYAAFVRQDVDYLWRTLHPDHDTRRDGDRKIWEAQLRRGLPRLRYKGLRILDTSPADADGVARVLFHVTLWDRGKNMSFLEVSSFAEAEGGWRYLFGTHEPAPRAPDDARLADYE